MSENEKGRNEQPKSAIDYWDTLEVLYSQLLVVKAREELEAAQRRERRAQELYESALQVTRRLQAERQSLLARVEVALLGIASAS